MSEMARSTSSDDGATIVSTIPSQDIFRPTLLRSLDTAMLKLRPATRDRSWAMLQTIYTDTPTRFTIVSSIHQNDPADRLHFSVMVNVPYATFTLHFYGYWKTWFQITDVSMSEMGVNVPVCVANFVKSE